MFIDVHAHLNDEKFENIESVVENALSEKVDKIITAGFDIASSRKNLEIASRFPNVFATIGIHPEMVDELEKDYLEVLKEMSKNKKVVAIGEIGLDYHFKDDNKELQKETFVKQIELANFLDLPVVVHSRDAMGDTLELLKKHPPKKESLLHLFVLIFTQYFIVQKLMMVWMHPVEFLEFLDTKKMMVRLQLAKDIMKMMKGHLTIV